MYLYRAVKNSEILNYINGVNDSNVSIKGINTFKYEKGVKHVHFFKYAKHAFYFMNYQNSNNYSDDCFVSIMRVKIPDRILPNISYGMHLHVETYYDDSLKYNVIPLPEYVIPRNNFKFSYINKFSNLCNGNFDIDRNKMSFYSETSEYFQYWDVESIYYEYIKRLYASNINVVSYLKTIDLDSELCNFAKKIKKNKFILKNSKTSKMNTSKENNTLSGSILARVLKK